MAKTKEQTSFKNPDRDNTETPLDINPEKPGSLAPSPPMEAKLVGQTENQLFDLVEQASGLVAGFTRQATDRLQATETAMTRLISGDLTIDELASQYGELSTPEAEAAKAQLARVMNSIAVKSEKLDVEAAAINVQAKQAFVALGGLKQAFKLQAEGERVADARDEAIYQGEVRDAKNVKRDQDLDYRIEDNRLDKEDKDNRIEHKTNMNAIADQFRQAVRKGAKAGLALKQTQVDQKAKKINRIIGSGEQA